MERVSARRRRADRSPHAVLVWLEKNVRTKIEGTLTDKWIATPAKNIIKPQED